MIRIWAIGILSVSAALIAAACGGGDNFTPTSSPVGTSSQESLPLQSGDTVADNLSTSNVVVGVDLGRPYQLVPRDAIKPIYEPQFTHWKLTSLDPENLVIGVEINGESKAYPVSPLNGREMVNDVVGGVPILVTW